MHQPLGRPGTSIWRAPKASAVRGGLELASSGPRVQWYEDTDDASVCIVLDEIAWRRRRPTLSGCWR